MAGSDPKYTCRYVWMHWCSTLGLLRSSSHGLAHHHAYDFQKPAEAESRMWIDLNAALLKMIIKTSGFDGRKWILWCIWLVFSDFSHVCQHVKWVYFYSGWKKVTRKDVKLQFCWPAPGLFDRHTAILTKCDSSFSKPAPLKFLTPTPRWMAIGFLFWLKVVKPSVKMGKKAW